MSQWRYNAVVDGRSVPRLQIPILSMISDSLRAGKAVSGLLSWLTNPVSGLAIWPTSLPALTQNSVLIPTPGGFVVYEPKDGDVNYRDPAFDPKARPDFTKRRELFAGQPAFKRISAADSEALIRIYARAFSEFDDVMTAKLAVKDEASLSRMYGGCELFGSVRVARTMLAAASFGQLSNGGPLADEARIFLKYSANTMTCYFTIRYVDQDLVLGKRPGTMAHSMTADASLMFGLGEKEGFKYVTHWLSLSSGYMEVRDGLGMRVGYTC